MLEAVGHAVVVNPDPAPAAIAKREGWQTMRFERLGRRLLAIGVTALATIAGFAGSWIARAGEFPPPRQFPPRR